MKTSGNHGREQGQTKRRCARRALRARWVLKTLLAIAPLITRVIELVIFVINRTLK